MVITETPQQKLLYIAKQLGLKSLAGMQGTTRAVYDTIDQPATGPSTITFFDNVGQRAAPLTNVSDNQFQVGEALAIEAVQIARFDDEDPFFSDIIDPGPFVLSVRVGNQTIIKKVPLGGAFRNNTGTNNSISAKFWLNVPLIIPPQVRYTVELENVPATQLSSPRLSCFLYGTGVLLNLKTSL
jgi:hypothetical protein